MISKSFLKSSLIYTIGGALPMLSAIILLPFYTNYLSTQQFISLGFYISISMLFQVLFSYSIESFFGVKFTQLTGDEIKQRQFTGTISSLLIFIGIGLLLIISITGPFLFKLVFKEDIQVYFWPYGFLSILTAFFNSYFKTCTSSFIYLKRPERFLTFNITNFVLTIVLSLGGLYFFPGSLIGPIYARLISGIIIFVMSLLVFYSFSKWTFNREFLGELNKFCFPYLIYVIASWSLGYIDRYFLKSHVEKETLAAYDMLLKCFLGIEFIQNGLSAVIFPKVFDIWNRNQKLETVTESNRYFNVFGATNIITLIVFCIAVPPFLQLILEKQEYYSSFSYIGIVAGGYSVRAILYFYTSSILYAKRTWLLVKIFALSAAGQIIMTFFMVRAYGLDGALYAGVLTKILQVVLSALFSAKAFRYDFNFFKIYVLPFTFLIVSCILFVFHREYSILIYLLELLGFSALIYFTFRNEIKIVLKQYFSK